ncbi:lysine--tRNA ligase [Mycoplasma sp. SG1]|uniref:lysine--tRNA ligase n=1 Tax=Mycoplasma sp. SG1 TaxID=2810348 RepID=UPI002023FCE9|nr:lysine--tRNA ligase [Mycoplasma sp. SG1]URM52809.1 lysine--tRNA ligase [Mycoplasma sp. SG1]
MTSEETKFLNVIAKESEKIKNLPKDLKLFNLKEATNTTIFKLSKYKDYENNQLEELKTFMVFGRLIQKRIMGKNAIFATLLGFSKVDEDLHSKIQIYLNKKNCSSEDIDLFTKLDLGDIIWVEGNLFKTKLNELTIRVTKFKLLSKIYNTLPDKFHGLKNIELIYRRRYLDLIFNKDSKQKFYLRNKIIQYIRSFFINYGSLEVETPTLQELYGGAFAKPFTTFYNVLKTKYFLRIATEIYLKTLIVGNIHSVFEIGKNFRNEGLSPNHNPEFTAIEYYEANADLEDMMDRTEQLFIEIKDKFFKETKYLSNLKPNEEIFIAKDKPWKRISMVESIFKITKINFLEIKTFEEALKLAKEHNINVQKHENSIGHIINLFFEHYVEKTLIQPTFIYDFPAEISPLAKLSEKNKHFAQRFELFIDGNEYANAFNELNDPIIQYQKFKNQLVEKQLGNEEISTIDFNYLQTLTFGLPPTGGLGIGIDRMIMFFTKSQSIRDVILFPQLKPLNKHDDKENN